MLIPSKYEDLSSNLMILGSHIITILKSGKDNIEDVYERLNKSYETNLDQFFNALTFLWLNDIISVDLYKISLVKNDSEKTLHNSPTNI